MHTINIKPEPSVAPLFIVVPTYNRWQEARLSLACLLKSGYRDFEIVLVEDACTDGTAANCRAEFPEVTILHGDGDLWWSGATNMGTKYALEQGARFVMWINDDVRVEPGTIGHLMESLKRQAAKSVVCARIRLPGANEREWRGDPPPWHPEYREWRAPELPVAGDLPIEHPPGGQGVIIPAECFREVGFLDRDNLPMYWGDHDFHYRAMKAGYKYFISPQAVVWERPNQPPARSANIFTFSGAWWLLTSRGSPGNLGALRRHLKRYFPPRQYRRVFYPIVFRHLSWLAYGWLLNKPLLHKPLRIFKRSIFGKGASDASSR